LDPEVLKLEQISGKPSRALCRDPHIRLSQSLQAHCEVRWLADDAWSITTGGVWRKPSRRHILQSGNSGAGSSMMRMNLRNVAIATSTFACATLLSFGWSEQRGISLSIESAQARIGRPWTPVSVAGVARRHYRRAAYGYGAGVVGVGAVGAAAVAANRWGYYGGYPYVGSYYGGYYDAYPYSGYYSGGPYAGSGWSWGRPYTVWGYQYGY
jgi:hypothetical protein